MRARPDRAHQLPLRALAAVDQDALSSSYEKDRGRASVDGRGGPCRSEEYKLKIHRRIVSTGWPTTSATSAAP